MAPHTRLSLLRKSAGWSGVVALAFCVGLAGLPLGPRAEDTSRPVGLQASVDSPQGSRSIPLSATGWTVGGLQMSRGQVVAVGSGLRGSACVSAVVDHATGHLGPATPVPCLAPGVNGFAWTRVHTAIAPSPWVWAPMAYDPATRQLVLVGGLKVVQPIPASPVNTETVLDDTWALAHGSWQAVNLRQPLPVGSQPDALAYDPSRGSLVLVTAPKFEEGTATVTRPPTTWVWTGGWWSKVSPRGPTWGTQRPFMAYDPPTAQFVFAAGDGSGTWVLSKSQWVERGGSPKGLLAMVYDPVTRRLIGTASSAMWWWDGHAWAHLRNRESPGALPGSGPAGSIPSGGPWVTDWSAVEVVAFSRLAEPTATNLFTWLGSTWQAIPTKLNPAPNNPENFSLAWDGAVNGVVAFGGDEGHLTSSGAWVYGGNQTWVLAHSANTTSPNGSRSAK